MNVLRRFAVGDIVVAVVVGDVLEEGCGSLLLPRRRTQAPKSNLVDRVRTRCEHVEPSHRDVVHTRHTLPWFAVHDAGIRDDDSGEIEPGDLARVLQQLSAVGSPHVGIPLVGKSAATTAQLVRAVIEAILELNGQGHLLASISLWSTSKEKAHQAAEQLASWCYANKIGGYERSLLVARLWLSLMDTPEDPHHVAAGFGTRFAFFKGMETSLDDEPPPSLLWVLDTDGRLWRHGSDKPFDETAAVNVNVEHWRLSADLDDLMLKLGVPEARLRSVLVPSVIGARGRALGLLARIRSAFPAHDEVRFQSVVGGIGGLYYRLALRPDGEDIVRLGASDRASYAVVNIKSGSHLFQGLSSLAGSEIQSGDDNALAFFLAGSMDDKPFPNPQPPGGQLHIDQ